MNDVISVCGLQAVDGPFEEADVLLVEYDYREQANLRMPQNPERNRWFFHDVAAACEAARQQQPGDEQHPEVAGGAQRRFSGSP